MLVVSCLANNVFNSEIKYVPLSIKSFIFNANNDNADKLLNDLNTLCRQIPFSEERVNLFIQSIKEYQKDADKDYLITSLLDMFPNEEDLICDYTIVDNLNYLNRGKRVWN